MSTKITVWGTNGRLSADRQECQAYLREVPAALAGYDAGWNVRYTTDLTDEVWFYLRGEEYSAQLDHFANCIAEGGKTTQSSFASAAATDRTMSLIQMDAERGPVALDGVKHTSARPPAKRFSLFGGKSAKASV
jgi:predicted dehydrogenase